MYWLNQNSREFLKDYLSEGETAEGRIETIANHAEKILGIKGFSQKFQHYMSKGFYSLSSPVWANFGKQRGCPISCFGSYIEDSMEGILYSNAEVGMQTKLGGGTSGYFGDIRPAGSEISSGGKSDGSISFMRLFDTTTNICKQAQVRRGSFAPYLPIHHNDINQFLNIRHPGNPIQHLFPGVCVEDQWMSEMIEGDNKKREIWAKVLKSRSETGTPYIFFTDNANKNKPEVYANRKIYASNLCNEISLPSSENESFVCCLSSINLLHWKEIRNTDAVETLVYFLDAVMSEFIDKASSIKYMERSVNFARNHRALGLGVLGWHSYLQSQMIPFESMEAKYQNTEIFQTIRLKADTATKKLAELFGTPEVCGLVKRRNTTVMAVAPTTSSSFILGQVSQSIEPFRSNYYIKALAKAKITVKNPYLEKLLEFKNKSDSVVWQSILERDGSVQHLTFLSEEERAVFKTFKEISQAEIITQAIQRQKYIDQGQSLNLLIDPRTPAKQINNLLIEAWYGGIKGLYYQHSINASQELIRNLAVCKSCEG